MLTLWLEKGTRGCSAEGSSGLDFMIPTCFELRLGNSPQCGSSIRSQITVARMHMKGRSPLSLNAPRQNRGALRNYMVL